MTLDNSLYVCEGRHCNHQHQSGYITFRSGSLFAPTEVRYASIFGEA